MKNRMPKKLAIANFGHPVSKLWLRPWVNILILNVLLTVSCLFQNGDSTSLNWNTLLDPHSPHKLLYSLQIVESLSRLPKNRRRSVVSRQLTASTVDLFNLPCPKFVDLAFFRICRILINISCSHVISKLQNRS